MLTAQKIVAKLLEEGPYDIDDPLDKPEYPLGFSAERGDERIEWRHDNYGYRFSIVWKDEHTGEVRHGEHLGYEPVSVYNAERWVASEMQKWQDEGWQVQPL